MNLHNQFRPKSWKTFVGNEKVISAVDKAFSKENIPNSLIISGNFGLGKTTIARIIKNKLEIHDNDFYEFNAASITGIDNVREIEKDSKSRPLFSKHKIYVLDECFPAGTKIQTPLGEKNIEDFAVGDAVFSSHGKDKVVDVFKKSVPINRVMRLNFSNGKIIFCTTDHEIFTDSGWKRAKDLQKNDLTFPFEYDLLLNSESQNRGGVYGEENKEKEKLFSLQKRDGFLRQQSKRANLLLKRVLCKITNKNDRFGFLRILWGELCGGLSWTKREASLYVFEKVCCPIGDKTWLEENFYFRRDKKENIFSPQEVLSNRKGESSSKEMFKKDGEEQPLQRSNCSGKNEDYKKDKWNPQCVGREKGREWGTDKATSIVIGRSWGCLGSGISHLFGKTKRRVSDLLQGRYCSSILKNSDRSGWGRTQTAEDYGKRFKESEVLREVRLESSEIYKQENNAELFRGVIGDKEILEGKVTFYDLGVEKQHNYFANGMLVHNCQKLSKAALDAFLKVIEDCPNHCVFIFCTTEPEKIPAGIVSRCSKFALKPLALEEITLILKRVAKKVEFTLTKDIVQKIYEVSEGSPRTAISLLESILDVPADSALDHIQGYSEHSAEAKELFSLLLKSAPWSEVSNTIKQIKDDPETIRRACLGYMSAILLNQKSVNNFSDKCALIIEAFQNNWYNEGRAGLVLACYGLCRRK